MRYTYVGVVPVRDDGAVLVQHRDNDLRIPEPNKYGICGGRREPEDTSDEIAAVRELFEETGYVTNPKELQLLSSDEYPAGDDYVVRKFYCVMYDGEQPIHCFEGQDIRFFNLNELGDLDFCDPYHLDYLRQASERICALPLEGNRRSRI